MRDFDAPIKVARDRAVLKAFPDPFLRDRLRQLRPGRARRDPRRDLVLQPRLKQIKMPGFSDFDIARPRNRRIGILEVERVQEVAAIVALVAARLFIGAVRADALDIAVGEKALIVERIDLPGRAFLDEAVLLERDGEMLRQPMIRRARGAAEMVE